MRTRILIGSAFIAVFAAALALPPGSLGVLFLTHDTAAKPWWAFRIYELALPLYLLSAALLLVAAVGTFRVRRGRVAVAGVVAVFLAVSVYVDLLGTSGGVQELEGDSGASGAPSRVSCVVSFAGPWKARFRKRISGGFCSLRKQAKR